MESFDVVGSSRVIIMPVHTGIKIKGGIYKMKLLKRLFREEEGVTALEYGLIAALIAVVIIGAVTALGANLSTIFQHIADRLTV